MKEYDSLRVDLRSDTVTRPTQAMRTVMHHAKVGDDVLGDDPTVIELQNKVAKILGKEAGLFVPSGTMCNAIAIKTHTQPGDEIITERYSHIYLYEGGGYAALSGCSISLVDAENGIMKPEDVTSSIRKQKGSQGHFPNGTMVCVENTSNRGGGTCYSLESLDRIAKIAHENECTAHMDGARFFNASVSSNISPEIIARNYDSISICLSKGLGAPIGSVLVGTNQFIETAHRWRKMFGGGMRQSGIIASAGIFALENHIDLLKKDHIRAKILAESINQLDDFSVNVENVETNMVYVHSRKNAHKILDGLQKLGIDALSISPNAIRLVTHLHITDEDIERTISAFKAQCS